MALVHAQQLPTGSTVNYWRVVRVIFDPENGAVGAAIAGYLSKAARNAGAAPVTYRTYEWMGSDANTRFGDPRFTVESKNPRQLAYQALKDRVEYTGATDDLAD